MLILKILGLLLAVIIITICFFAVIWCLGKLLWVILNWKE